MNPEIAEQRLDSLVRGFEAQVRSNPIRVLFLDLDDTVRKGFSTTGRFVNGPEDVEIFPEALAAMREYKAAGWRIVSVSNQGGVAMGMLSPRNMFAAQARTYQLCEGMFDYMLACVHHPDSKEPFMANCWCRKPRIGMILEGAAAVCSHGEMSPPELALMVGDLPEDEQCAKNAGVRFIWAPEWRAGAR